MTYRSNLARGRRPNEYRAYTATAHIPKRSGLRREPSEHSLTSEAVECETLL